MLAVNRSGPDKSSTAAPSEWGVDGGIADDAVSPGSIPDSISNHQPNVSQLRAYVLIYWLLSFVLMLNSRQLSRANVHLSPEFVYLVIV
jgi:hypothetical protein